MDTETITRGRPLAQPRDGNRLREYRLRANMTQEQLAEFLNVHQGKISKAEVTGLGLGNDKWFQLSDLFNVDPRVLRGWQPVPPDTSPDSSN